jgi:hypothetical protein
MRIVVSYEHLFNCTSADAVCVSRNLVILLSYTCASNLYNIGRGEINVILLNIIIFYSILFYSILFYSILFYPILFYSILFYSILFYSILFYSILLYYIILYYIILYYIILYYIILYYIILSEVGSAIFLGGALSLECYLFFDVR